MRRLPLPTAEIEPGSGGAGGGMCRNRTPGGAHSRANYDNAIGFVGHQVIGGVTREYTPRSAKSFARCPAPTGQYERSHP